MDKLIIKSKFMITDVRMKASGILTDRAVFICNGKISEIDTHQHLIEKYPDAIIKGSGKQLLMPGLIDSHSHGLGISPFQQGVPYDFLENNFYDWNFGFLPDPELHAIVCAIKHLRNGCTTIHCLNGGPIEKIEKVIQGFQKTGIRLAFGLSVNDMNRLALDNTAFLKTLPEDLQDFAKPLVYNDKKAIHDTFFHAFEYLYDRYNAGDIRINYAPSLATMCSDGFLQEVKARSDEKGKLPIHIHTLQTPVQKAYAMRTFGKSQIEHFKDIGLLDENLTLGHAVFLADSDIDLLAAYGVSTTHHPNCNFMMRNGISPVSQLLKAGVKVAIGIDDKGFNDDEDIMMELRLAHRLHRTSGFDLIDTPMPDAFDILELGTINAAKVCGYPNEIGRIEPGMNADLILVDLDEMMNDPFVSPDMSMAEIFIHRAKGRHVHSVIVGGNVVMEDRVFLNVDVESLYAEVRKQMRRGLDPKQKKYAETLQLIKPYCQRWYQGWIS